MTYDNGDLPSSEGTLGYVNANPSESLRASLLFCVHIHMASLRQGCHCEKTCVRLRCAGQKHASQDTMAVFFFRLG